MLPYFQIGYRDALVKVGQTPSLPTPKPFSVPGQTTANNISGAIMKSTPASINVATQNMADAQARVAAKFSSASDIPDNVPRRWGPRQPLMNVDNMHSGRTVNQGFKSVDDPTLALHGDISGMGNEDRGAP